GRARYRGPGERHGGSGRVPPHLSKEKLRSDVASGPGLRNRDPTYVSGPLPEPVRRGARPWCYRPFWLRPVALWHRPMRARRHLLVRRLANRRWHLGDLRGPCGEDVGVRGGEPRVTAA